MMINKRNPTNNRRPNGTYIRRKRGGVRQRSLKGMFIPNWKGTLFAVPQGDAPKLTRKQSAVLPVVAAMAAGAMDAEPAKEGA